MDGIRDAASGVSMRDAAKEASMSEKDESDNAQDAAGGAEGGMAGGSAGGPGQGDTLKDLSDEAVREMENRRDGAGHAGTGDYG